MKIQCKIQSENGMCVLDKLFHSDEYSDVSLLVGSTEIKEFKAHRCVLMAASEKLKDLLQSHSPGKPIPIPEIEPDVFEQIMK